MRIPSARGISLRQPHRLEEDRLLEDPSEDPISFDHLVDASSAITSPSTSAININIIPSRNMDLRPPALDLSSEQGKQLRLPPSCEPPQPGSPTTQRVWIVSAAHL